MSDQSGQELTELERLKAENARLKAQLSEQGALDSAGGLAVQRMRQLLDLLPAGVLLIDRYGRVSECNPASESLLGTPLKGESWVAIIQRSFAPKKDDGIEISLKDGRKVRLLTRPLEYEPGQLVLLTDQTDTRLLQSRLSHYQRLSEMGRMMASLAHQIRTPLSAALLYASHLTGERLDDQKRVRFARKVKDRLIHLEQQVKDMLIFARGETQLDDRITLEALFTAIDDQLDLPLAQHDADCHLENLAEGYVIQCNKEILLGAILNLVNNALQAAGNAHLLVIKAYPEGERILIQVIDQGPGMSREAIQKAMEPFFTTKSHGTGLGLAVAQVVAKAHQGDFKIASIEGQGTCAQLSIPYWAPKATHEGEQA